jgi:hypothetical protein
MDRNGGDDCDDQASQYFRDQGGFDPDPGCLSQNERDSDPDFR